MKPKKFVLGLGRIKKWLDVIFGLRQLGVLNIYLRGVNKNHKIAQSVY